MAAEANEMTSGTGAGGTGFELTYDGPGIKSLGYISVGDPANPPRGCISAAAPEEGVNTSPERKRWAVLHSSRNTARRSRSGLVFLELPGAVADMHPDAGPIAKRRA